MDDDAIIRMGKAIQGKNLNIINKKIYILLIGPVTNISAQLVGGATISFGYLVDYLQKEEEAFSLVNTQKYLGFKKIFNPFYVLFKVFISILKTDIVFLNTSQKGTRFLAPLLFFMAKMFGKKFIFRPFGGNMKEYTQKYGSFQKWLFEHTVLKADILFLQTKELMEFYASKKANTIQLPTSRNTPDHSLQKGNRPFSKRFIYLGALYPTKGIDHILEAKKQLEEDYLIHIYGPSKNEEYKEKFERQKGVYQGVLKKEEVLHCLKEYDVLILPSYYDGEGYPGVIMEAYSLGLPVITTIWKSIPEIVKNEETGILIPPKSTVALVKAMQGFNTSNYPKYSHHALSYFSNNFSTEKVTGQAIEEVKQLITQKGIKK
ncbi:MAG: glycosyltransferase involved in cell wall biosynthesis [Maribacter sp.]